MPRHPLAPFRPASTSAVAASAGARMYFRCMELLDLRIVISDQSNFITVGQFTAEPLIGKE